ncbi:MAG TPA: hypothetical protein VKH35_05580 [Thermoanaerobaculia bacterium]|jgi:hypothetical protein|nr:hypothetical protein [Thermoanaerobaculia bacterium]
MADGPNVVLRYRNGSTSRASLLDTDSEREVFRIAVDDGTKSEVPFGVLKAVFYPHAEAAEPEQAEGSQLAVEFADGEIIRGIAHYNPEKNGFFLFPLDRSKNDKVFVVNSAIVSIEVEKL